MKKLILTLFVCCTSLGILFAEGNCQKKDYVQIKKSKSELVLTINNLQLLKIYDKNGNARFTIKDLEGTVLAENLSRLELSIEFPEIEKKFES